MINVTSIPLFENLILLRKKFGGFTKNENFIEYARDGCF